MLGIALPFRFHLCFGLGRCVCSKPVVLEAPRGFLVETGGLAPVPVGGEERSAAQHEISLGYRGRGPLPVKKYGQLPFYGVFLPSVSDIKIHKAFGDARWRISKPLICLLELLLALVKLPSYSWFQW